MKVGFPKSLKTGEKFAFKTTASAVYADDSRSVQDYLNTLQKYTSSDIGTLKVGVIGDSILTGHNPTGGTPITTYVNLLADRFGTVINYAMSDTFLAETTAGTTTKPEPIVNRYATMSNDLDIVIIHACSNDWYFNTPIGVAGDTEKTTYYGAVENLINGLTTKYVNKEIFFVTSLPRYSVLGDGTVYTAESLNLSGHTLVDYNNVIKELCARHTIPVIDIYSECGMDIVNSQAQREYYTVNGLHLSNQGHERCFRRIFNAIMSKI